MKTTHIINLIVLIVFIFFFYIVLVHVSSLYKNKKLKKETFIIRKDERCSQTGQIFSDFQPGTVCLKPGFIKTI